MKDTGNMSQTKHVNKDLKVYRKKLGKNHKICQLVVVVWLKSRYLKLECWVIENIKNRLSKCSIFLNARISSCISLLGNRIWYVKIGYYRKNENFVRLHLVCGLCWWGKRNSPLSFQIILAGLRIKLTWERLTGEKSNRL